MESKKINQLATNVAPQTSDLTIIGDPITGVSKKITLLQIANLFATTGTVSSVAVTETGDALTITGSPITSAGTINIGFAGDATQYIRGDGALADFPTSTGGGSSVSYYLNSSVSQGTIGGVAYREFSKDPIAGAGTDITASTNGYIASYLTDANDPALLEVPAGNFNCEFYFSVNSNAHNPYVYAEIYNYDGTTFTLLGSSQSVPEYLTNGTTLSPYYFAIPVTQTTLAITDRIAIRIYVNVDGRVVTLHTENNHLCQVVTTFSKGLTSLNNLTRQVQFLATGTSGTDFNISSSTATHTFNLPVASATNTGKLSSTDWSTFNNKQPAGNYVTLDTTQTITAAKTFSGVNTFSQNPVINGTGTNSAYTILQSDGTNKWRIGNNYASGVNTFDIFSYDNSSTPLSINSNGFMTLSANVITTGAQIVQNGLYLNNVQAGPYGGYTNMWGATDGINFLLGNAAGGAKFIFASANSYNYTFPAATGTLALTSNLSAYLPLTGGTLTGALSGTSATFSGDLTIDTNTLYVDSTNNRVGIGTSSPTNKLHILNDGNTLAAMRITDTNANGSFLVLNASNSDAAIIANGTAAIPLDFYTGGVARMRISSDGNVGIGVNPTQSAPLTFADALGQKILLNNNANNYRVDLVANVSGGDAMMKFIAGSSTAGEVGFYTTSNLRMLITSGGNVGIGTSSPSSFGGGGLSLGTTSSGKSLILYSSSNGNNGLIQFIDLNGADALQIGATTVENYIFGYGSRPLLFSTNATERMRITSGGNVCVNKTSGDGKFNIEGTFYMYGMSSGAGTSTLKYSTSTGLVTYDSSARIFKKDIVNLEYGLDAVLKMQPKKYKWKSNNIEDLGFIADEMHQIIPEIVFLAENKINKSELKDGEPMGINYDRLVPVLVKAIQEQQAQIDELKAKIK